MMMENTNFDFHIEKDALWCKHLGITDFDGLNKIIRNGKAIQLVNLCEARHENRCSRIAHEIKAKGGVRVVLLAGPSSSGKTSTSLRIALQCKVHGLNPRTIEVDNYFLERDETPLLPNGNKDFESLAALDVELLNRQLNELLEGKEVELPRYDFKDGRKYYEGNMMKLEENDLLILEGIHALNPAMTPNIPDDVKFMVYVSDMSSISEYDKDIMTTDNRLMRRMVRDNRTRGISPEQTILRWADVREGEEKYIFPYQDNADMVFNSTLQYELPLLKHYVTPILKAIDQSSKAFPEAQRLLGFLSKIDALPVDAINAIPCTSIMREFIGGQILSRELL